MSESVVRFVRNAVGPDAGGPSDAELLKRFAATRDAGAFELLVWRHAGMVRAAAWAVVRDHHLAEDAAQAAFLALAKRAGSVRENPAGWLYRVARRIAAKQRRAAGVSRLMAATDRSDIVAGGGISRLTPAARQDADELAALQQELAALPDKYRLPVLLCFVEGLSHADAAARLGWPVGTVAGRIARAKDTLRVRLARRGLAPALTALAVAGGDGPFAAATARAAVAFAAGDAAGVSPTVLPLVHGAMRAMTFAKLKLAAGLVAACGALTAGGVWAAGQAGGTPAGGAGFEPQPPAAAAPPPKVERLKVDPKAPNPGKPEDPKRTADYEARRTDVNKLKQIALAFHNYAATYGTFVRDVVSKDGKPLLSWRVQLLPYIEQEALYKQFKLDEPWDSPNNQPLLKLMPDVYRLAFQPASATSTYMQAFAGPGTVFDPARQRMTFGNVTDGSSQTLMFAAVGPPVPWAKPADVAYDPAKPFPEITWPYANAVPAANLDGACYHMIPDVSEETLRRYIEVADDQPWPRGEFEKLWLKFPADTAEEKALVRKLLAESAASLAALNTLMAEYLAAVDAGTATLLSPEHAADLNEQLKRMLAAAKAELAELKAKKK